MKIYCGNKEMFNNAVEAKTYFQRLKGLIGRKSIDFEEAMLFRKCPNIHCCWMKIPIDVIYLDENDVVLKVETVNPWKMGSKVKGNKHVLECGQGVATVKGIAPGMQLTFVD